ncbi:MAG: [FeFe] hydrogenase H-cluster maturation GTPase HydF [Desulfovibrionaceae bacterium]|nr:[FeFe] hydrogenase H-cluster maturation GTPase HydF [Desulfovibrionaceae bacterium]
MTTTHRGNRLQIAILGRCNTGKSTLLNRIIGQNSALVSERPGTTADPVQVHFELLPYGPVTFYDTAGMDEAGALGALRLSSARTIMARADIALVVTDESGLGQAELALIDELLALETPVLVVFNKGDRRPARQQDLDFCREKGIPFIVSTPADDADPAFLREALLALTPQQDDPPLVCDLLSPASTVICVTPIDASAPKGRLIAPQVQVLRELVEAEHLAVLTQGKDLPQTLARLVNAPDLVITDSQVVRDVIDALPEDIRVTTFSMLFARLKGDFPLQHAGALHIASLRENDAVLVAEACSHHAQSDDIARVKIPNLLQKRAGCSLEFSFYSGSDFPEDLSRYALVLHCGGCMLNRREMRRRLRMCARHGVPVTNYGMAISFAQGVLERVARPIMQADQG